MDWLNGSFNNIRGSQMFFDCVLTSILYYKWKSRKLIQVYVNNMVVIANKVVIIYHNMYVLYYCLTSY